MNVKRVPKIFISYRRDDASASVNHLHETLTRHFGAAAHVFRDIRDIGAGAVFVEAIKAEINSSDILLAVIGRDWLTITEQKRSTNEDDYVRLEIVTALTRGRDLVVIPVLVEGARLPRKQDLPDDLHPLIALQSAELSDRWWERDVNQLIQDLAKALAASGKGEVSVPDPKAESGQDPKRADASSPKAKPTVPSSLYSLFGGSLAGLIAGIIISVIYTSQQNVGSTWLSIERIGRIGLTGAYGLVAGAVMSCLINVGLSRSSKVMNGSRFSKVVGGTVGGALGGILASMMGGLAYAQFEGKPISLTQVIVAVGCSTFFITLGVLMPEMNEEWHKRLVIIIILVCVAFVLVITTTFAGKLLGPEDFSNWFYFLKVGLIIGLMSGLQAGSALFVYYCFEDESESAGG